MTEAEEHLEDEVGTGGERLADRFRIEGRIGAGSQAETFRAVDEQTGETVCVKRVVVSEVDDWNSVQLFEREAETLQRLDHEAIPALVDAFHNECGDGGEQFVLVQQFVDGKDLEQLLDDGTPFTEQQLRELAEQILETLQFLHSHDPPVIHRDIKPSNIMRRASDRRFVLVDFGTVRVAAVDPTSETTTVGTVGYTPLEQLMGQVQPASDLYALGATLIHLASRTHPGELPVKNNAIDFRGRVDVSDDFARFVERLIKPAPEDRFSSAQQALRWLEDPPPAPEDESLSVRAAPPPIQWEPESSRLEAYRDGNVLRFIYDRYTVGCTIFAVGGGLIATFPLAMAVASTTDLEQGQALLRFGLLPLVVLAIIVPTVASRASHRLELTDDTLRFRSAVRRISAPLDAIRSVDSENRQVCLEIDDDGRRHQIRFGPKRGDRLTEEDSRRVAEEVRRHLG